jgi:hypothetical protein
MAQSIFISYSRKDKSFAQSLVHTLEHYGLDTWIDSDDIRAGIKWSSAIQEGLKQSSVMLVVISPDSMESKNVEDEWQYFLDKKKPIIPILHRPTDNIHFQLMRIQYVDFVNNSFEDALKRLIFELRQAHIDIVDPSLTDISNKKPAVQFKPKIKALPLQNIIILSIVLALIAAGILLYLNRGQNPLVDPGKTEIAASVSTLPSETITDEATSEATEIPEATTVTSPEIGVILDVPYVSQFDGNASIVNDDAPAALLMVLKWYAQNNPDNMTAQRAGRLSLDTVNDEMEVTSETTTVSFGELIRYAARFDLTAQACNRISQQRIFEELENDRPVFMLIKFNELHKNESYTGAHSVVIIGYNETEILLYDSFSPDDNSPAPIISVNLADFEHLVNDIPNTSLDAQGLIFGEDNTC